MRCLVPIVPHRPSRLFSSAPGEKILDRAVAKSGIDRNYYIILLLLRISLQKLKKVENNNICNIISICWKISSIDEALVVQPSFPFPFTFLTTSANRSRKTVKCIFESP